MSGVRLASYRCILVDCPTKFKGGTKGRPQHYERMTDEALMAFPVRALAHPEGAWLFFWDTTPRIDITPRIARAWGFKRSSIAWYWFKTRGEGESLALTIGTGLTTRKNVEPCHLFKVGHPARLGRDIPDSIFAPRREHSQKPDEQYPMIERFCAGPRVELFARTRRPGWTSWGNEVDKFKPEGK